MSYEKTTGTRPNEKKTNIYPIAEVILLQTLVHSNAVTALKNTAPANFINPRWQKHHNFSNRYEEHY